MTWCSSLHLSGSCHLSVVFTSRYVFFSLPLDCLFLLLSAHGQVTLDLLEIFLRDFMDSKEVGFFLLKTLYHPFILTKNCFQVWNQYFVFSLDLELSHLTPLFLPVLMLSHCILADECIQVFLWPWTNYLISFPVSAEVLLSISLKHPLFNPSHIFQTVLKLCFF